MTDPEHENPTIENARMIGSAAARLIRHKWACPDCAGVYGCHSSTRDCESCSPPRNPVPPARHLWDDEI